MVMKNIWYEVSGVCGLPGNICLSVFMFFHQRCRSLPMKTGQGQPRQKLAFRHDDFLLDYSTRQHLSL